MNIIEAWRDRALFGALPAFRDLATWRAWETFLAALKGLPLPPEEQARFCKHTGRSSYAPPEGGWREAVCIVGRQSGKSRIAALVASYEAAMAAREPDRTELYALLVAQDHRAALRTLMRYAVAPFERVPLLERMVEGRTADTLTLGSGVVLAAYPCRPAAVRGLRARVAVCDEAAYFQSTEGNPTDTEMLRALRPCLATTGGKLLILSSPYGQSGALWELHRQNFGRDDAPVLVWQASAPEMNPTLPADYLDRMEQDDPEAYRSEVLGEFRAGIASLFDPDVLQEAVERGVHERAREAQSYAAHFDASGGRSDAAALAIGHSEGELFVLDVVRRWPAPHNPEHVIAEAAGVLKGYGVREVQLDRFAGEFPSAAFIRSGLSARVCESNTSDNHLALLPRVNAGKVLLLDVPELLRELRGLERRRGLGGRDRVDHRPGAHDDVAAAVAGLAAMLTSDANEYYANSEAPSVWFVDDGDSRTHTFFVRSGDDDG